ncbi:MAG: phosphoserine phosphatase SerB [Gammaproteobacteria bacterium]|nr:MAG: phosphoserine phosphatase SerB [Gammaproteobacteria bacterium]
MDNQYCLALLNKGIADKGFSIAKIKAFTDVTQLEASGGSQHKLLFKITSPSQFDELNQNLQRLSKKYSIDCILKPWVDKDVKPGLIIMDMDSTLVQAETIDEIARVVGVGDKVAQITEAAMRGELDFTESLIARVSMLKGMPLELLEQVHASLPLTAGAEMLLKNAKKNSCHTALVSGGFTLFAGPIAEKLGFDTLSANTLEIVNNKLTGRVIGKIVDGESKLKTLQHLQKKLSLNTKQIVAIGDGANDLPMLGAAGTGFAFHAKPKVQEQAKSILNFNTLDGVSWYLNW